MTIRVMGVDPGLTRCGLAVVDVEPNRHSTLVAVGVVGTEAGTQPGPAAAGDRGGRRRMA